MSLKITGKLPSGKHRETIRKSSNFRNGAFQTLTPTPMMAEDASYWKMIKDYFKKNSDTVPSAILPSVKTNLNELRGDGPVVVWFGHSSYFIRLEGRNILVDPVFSGNAAPFSFMVKSFPGSDVYAVEDMPSIDALIITHDHYDHLDYKTMRKLRTKVRQVFCPLGVGSHLRYWGFEDNMVKEMDWWDEATIDERIVITAAPARHFSGRGIKRNQTLWASFILKSGSHSVYVGGDSGYDHHFRSIGENYGPFDLVLLECGQYNPMWPLIHMTPEEAFSAALDLNAKRLLPVHWGKFTLAMHAWNEPVNRVVEAAKAGGPEVVVPMIGEPIWLDLPFSGKIWWNR